MFRAISFVAFLAVVVFFGLGSSKADTRWRDGYQIKYSPFDDGINYTTQNGGAWVDNVLTGIESAAIAIPVSEKKCGYRYSDKCAAERPAFYFDTEPTGTEPFILDEPAADEGDAPIIDLGDDYADYEPNPDEIDRQKLAKVIDEKANN